MHITKSIWISFCNLKQENDASYHHARFTSHHRLASPVSTWEQLKIGAGTPPVLTKHGWMILYHGVHELKGSTKDARKLCYSAGVMILSEKVPCKILYRSAKPVLKPVLPEEKVGTIANVVFPTGIDRRDDIGGAQTAESFAWYTAEFKNSGEAVLFQNRWYLLLSL